MNQIIKTKTKAYVWPTCQFLANEKQEADAMLMILQKCTPEWKRLESLTPNSLSLQLKEYVKVYGSVLLKKMNSIRNQSQQDIRKEWMQDYKEGNKTRAKQYLGVAQRPDVLFKLPEITKNGKPIKKNIEANKNNKKYRDRFYNWTDTYIPAICSGLKAWSENQRSNNIVSNYLEGSGKEAKPKIPAALEAQIILQMENAQDKWAWEAEWEMKNGKKLDEKDRKTDYYKNNCPKTLYSTRKGGSEKYGAWTPQGRQRFKRLRQLIQQGRNKEKTQEIEEQVRLGLLAKYQPKKPKDKKPKAETLDFTNAAVGWDDEETEEELDIEEYDSEEEEEAMAIELPEAAAAAPAPAPAPAAAADGDAADGDAADGDNEE